MCIENKKKQTADIRFFLHDLSYPFMPKQTEQSEQKVFRIQVKNINKTKVWHLL